MNAPLASTPLPTVSPTLLGLRCLFGLAVVLAVAVALTPDAVRDAGGTLSPFGSVRLLVVHLIAALPAAVVLVRAFPGMMWAGVATLPMWVVLADTPDAVDLPLLVRSVGRWLLSVLLLSAFVRFRAGGRVGVNPSLGVVVAMVGVVAPLVYADRLIEVRQTRLDALLETGRLTSASRQFAILHEIGAAQTAIGGKYQKQSATWAKTIDALTKSISRPLPESATDAQRVEYAYRHIQVDRLDEAERLLGPMTARSLPASMILASLLRDRERFAEAKQLYADLLSRNPPEGMRAVAVEGLIESHIGLDEPRRAEEVIEAELARTELAAATRASLHLRLGQLLADRGETRAALDSLGRVADLDPKRADDARTMSRGIRTATPSCLPFFK